MFKEKDASLKKLRVSLCVSWWSVMFDILMIGTTGVETEGRFTLIIACEGACFPNTKNTHKDKTSC